MMNSTPNADPRIAAYAESAQTWRDSALEHIAYAARYKGLLNEAINQLQAAGKSADASSLARMRDAVEPVSIPAPYAGESWREIADHQLSHDPTPEQVRIKGRAERIGLVHGE